MIKMLDYQVISKNIHTEDDLHDMMDLFNRHNPVIGAFDTETTGLHLKSDSPFLFQWGWFNFIDNSIRTYTVDIEQRPDLAHRTIMLWNNLAKRLKYYAGHNVGFDLHMIANINKPYEGINLVDTQACIRLAHDNIPQRFGGPPMSLKNYSAKYIDATAKTHDKALQSERSSIAKKYNRKLQMMLKKYVPDLKPDGYNSWTVKAIQEITKDVIFDEMDLGNPKVTAIYKRWKKGLPEGIQRRMHGRVSKDDVPYNILNRENVVTYGHYDIVYTIAIFLKTYHIAVDHRQNKYAMNLERKLIPVFNRMERVGFKANKDYLIKAKDKMRKYIISKRTELYELAGEEVSVSQHKRIKELFLELFDEQLKSTGADVLDKLLITLDKSSKEYKFINIIQELRTLEKWYSTYLVRLLQDLKLNPRLYTQINSTGTASGRVSSDFQQFPKYGIKDDQGKEIFNPRRVILAEKDGNVYMDYSQIELRIQAIYTILLNEPDKNLCRAYMPYKCYRYDFQNNKEQFNYNDPKHIEQWQDDWYKEEDDEIWTPLDLHGATTKEAFGVDESHPDWKKLRSAGKRMNFAKNYGAQLEVTRNIVTAIMPDISEEELKHIDGAYYRAFPGIRTYQDYCYRLANNQARAVNLLGANYWNVTGHKLINMLIQGSGAYLLKEKIYEIDEYLENKYTVIQMNIHDEISFIYDARDGVEIFKDIKRIMEKWDDAPVPIVVDGEITYTNWAEKEDWEI